VLQADPSVKTPKSNTVPIDWRETQINCKAGETKNLQKTTYYNKIKPNSLKGASDITSQNKLN
jgi:hypothetical protein